jgi:phosphoglycolate phosphatase-like HAD superfamily hydrolase/predicted amidophosphoribosyltransferase
MHLVGIVFDLDDTLLDTSALRVARSQRDWGSVKALLDRVQPFPTRTGGISVESLPARLKADGLKVGILTHAPRWYAETLVRRFGIPFDAMITGSDPYPPKPDPRSLRQIMSELGADVSQSAYVGDDPADIAAAAAARALSIGACWSGQAPNEWRRRWPDIAVATPEHLLNVGSLESLAPFAEVVLAGGVPFWHWGTLMQLEHEALACGRYFTSQDTDRHPGHALSALVLQAKNEEAAARRVADILSLLTGYPDWIEHRPALIVSVPPRPGQGFDRFAVVRATVAAALQARDGVGVLSMRFDVEDYKHLRPDERRAVNDNRFRSRSLQGERVLLIDDVITSGGQTESCRQELIRAGAGSVTVLALAATQDRLPEACPICGTYLRVYHRRSDGRPFIGCPSFFTTGCPYRRDAGDQPT